MMFRYKRKETTAAVRVTAISGLDVEIGQTLAYKKSLTQMLIAIGP